MNVYSTRFIAVHDSPIAYPNVYTVPAGFVAVVREMDVYFGPSLAARKIFAEGTASQIFWEDSVAAVEDGWRQWQGRQVFYASESFQLFCAGDVGDITVSGYLLAAP